MHDIWNPWHGCVKISEGWENVFFNVSCENQRRAKEIHTVTDISLPILTSHQKFYAILLL